jgi:hypothetical protein
MKDESISLFHLEGGRHPERLGEAWILKYSHHTKKKSKIHKQINFYKEIKIRVNH